MNIIITGTHRGIGLECALLLAQKGHQILALSRKENILITNSENCSFISTDLSVPSQLNQVEEFIKQKWNSKVDILINNAGTLLNKPFATITPDELEYVYKVNVFGLFYLTQLAVKYMNSGAHVVSISSMGGIQGSMKFAGLSAYSSSKGAIITLSELLAQEYAQQGISFNTLALGAVQTEMLNEAFPDYQAPINATEMAQYICNFALDANKYINGKTIQVSSSTP
ncbi:MAG: SDR family oxidoreductase [Bacteroidota bacterium]|nr:SDR family oxidoreductase [Bacteroidota bacterium]